MTKEEIIKEFREKFVGSDGRIYSGTLTAGKIEQFLLKALQAQKEDLLEKIEEIDVSGGGSGRRLKIQIKQLLK